MEDSLSTEGSAKGTWTTEVFRILAFFGLFLGVWCYYFAYCGKGSVRVLFLHSMLSAGEQGLSGCVQGRFRV